MLKRSSLQKSLCPVVICPYLCSSEGRLTSHDGWGAILLQWPHQGAMKKRKAFLPCELYIYICIYIHTYIHTYIYIYIHVIEIYSKRRKKNLKFTKTCKIPFVYCKTVWDSQKLPLHTIMSRSRPFHPAAVIPSAHAFHASVLLIPARQLARLKGRASAKWPQRCFRRERTFCYTSRFVSRHTSDMACADCLVRAFRQKWTVTPVLANGRLPLACACLWAWRLWSRSVACPSQVCAKPRVLILNDMAVSTLFVTTASTEMLNGTILSVTFCSSPPCPICFQNWGGKTKVTPKIVLFSKKDLAI